jgi:CHAD domain-containing protein
VRIAIPNARKKQGERLTRILARQLDESWQAYARRFRRFRKRGPSGPVHKLRVSARRLLTSLELMNDLDPDYGLGPASRGLLAQFKAMGAMRDAEVQRAELEALPLSKPKRKALRRVLRKRERRLRRSVLAAKNPGAGREIGRVCAALAAAPSDDAATRRLRAGLDRALRAAFLRADRLRPRDARGLIRLHRARIAIKRLRYLVEFMKPVAGDHRALLRALARSQTLMGDIHDADVLAARLRKWKAKGRLGAAELRTAGAPVARRRRTLLARYFRASGALFDGTGPLARLGAG